MPDDDAWIARSELLARAWQFAYDAHEGERSVGDTRIEHPAAVARLLLREHADEDVVAAGLLHDVLEDTTVTKAEIAEAFGAGTAALVADLSENPAIDSYVERKHELRLQVARSGEDAALIFLADKLATLAARDKPLSCLPIAKLEHYRQTVVLLARRYPQLPFIDELVALLELR